MKRFLNRSISLVIAVCVLLSLVPAIKADAAGATDYTEFFGYTQMTTKAQRDAYIKMADAVVNMDGEGVRFEANTITKEEISRIAMLLPYDLPQAFYFRGPHYLSMLSDGDIVFIPVFVLNSDADIAKTDAQKEEVRKQKDALDKRVKKIVQSVPASIDTDYEKSVYVYDLVVNMAEYKETEHDQTAYGALVEGKCVCAGYAAAYTLIMRELGVKTWMVYGTANNGRETEAHAWNVAWIDGDCVYTDPTWGDLNGIVRYNYLNLSGLEMAKDHYADAMYGSVLTPCAHNGHKHDTQSVKVQSIELATNTKTQYKVGETWQIKGKVVPEDADNKAVVFSSSNTSVVTVSSSGVVTAVGEGEATVTIRSVDGGALTSLNVVVKTPQCEHELKLVKKIAPTCQTYGTKAYYACTLCGAAYMDENGFLPVDAKKLELDMVPHEGEKYRYNDTQHWCCCVVCEIEIDHNEHDLSVDGKCAICGYFDESAAEKPTEPIEPDIPTAPSQTEPTEPNKPSIPSVPEETKGSHTENQSNPQSSDGSPHTNTSSWMTKYDPWAVGCCIVAGGFILSVAIVVFVLYRKKHAQKS